MYFICAIMWCKNSPHKYLNCFSQSRRIFIAKKCQFREMKLPYMTTASDFCAPLRLALETMEHGNSLAESPTPELRTFVTAIGLLY
jgi:hypothetical protein